MRNIKHTLVLLLIIMNCVPNKDKENYFMKKRDVFIYDHSTDKIKKDLPEFFLLDNKKVFLMDKINGNIKDSISNDTTNEKYYNIIILQQKNKWLYIKAYAISDKKIGWVFLNRYFLGTYSANYDYELKIYSAPNIESSIIYIFPPGMPIEPLIVLDWYNDWVKINYKNKVIGWIKREWTCPNPYSTCN